MLLRFIPPPLLSVAMMVLVVILSGVEVYRAGYAPVEHQLELGCRAGTKP